MAGEKKNQAREDLLDSAERLFTRKGYAAVSTRELADEAGVNLGAIQYHFGSKGQLFVETIKWLMERSAVRSHGFGLENITELRTSDDAALRLTEFIEAFLNHLLRNPEAQGCRLMYREIFSETAQDPEMFEVLITSALSDFIRPVDDKLIALLRQLKPEADELELGLAANSILGQCSFYFTHRPFLERLRNVNVTEEKQFKKIAAHIAAFTLRGLGCSPDISLRRTAGSRKPRSGNKKR